MKKTICILLLTGTFLSVNSQINFPECINLNFWLQTIEEMSIEKSGHQVCYEFLNSPVKTLKKIYPNEEMRVKENYDYILKNPDEFLNFWLLNKKDIEEYAKKEWKKDTNYNYIFLYNSCLTSFN